MRLTFLGTGPAGGLAGKGKSRRRESSLLVRTDQGNLLIDVTTDFVEQSQGVAELAAVMVTHGHRDAIGGVGKLNRWLEERKSKVISVYTLSRTIEVIKKRYKRLGRLRFVAVKAGKKIKLLDLKVEPIQVRHSIQPGFPTLGFAVWEDERLKLVYLSDVASWRDEDEVKLSGAELLIIDGAMWERKMAAHLTIKRVLPIVCWWHNRRVLFTQIGKEAPSHETANKEVGQMCAKAGLAYDGLKLTI